MSQPPDKLKVLVLTAAMTHGGSQRFVAILLEHLDRDAFAPELVTIADAKSDYSIPPDVRVTALPFEPRIEPDVRIELPADVLEAHAAELVFVQIAVDQIAHAVERLKPDIVVGVPEFAAVLAAAASPRFPPTTRLVCRVGAVLSVGFPPTGTTSLLSAMMGSCYNRADCVVANSRAIARDLIENFGVDADRITVLHNPLDVSNVRKLSGEPVRELDLEDGVPTIVFTGRLERVKGLDYLLRAMAQVLEVTSARCVVIGGGSHRGYLVALAKHLGISEAVHFVGSQSNPYRFMSKSTVFVLPSLSEGMPNVLLEAMACGCPVIASDIAGGATRDLLENGVSGVLVPRGDADALGAAIVEVLGDFHLRGQLTQNGLRRADDFDLPKTMTETEELLLSVAHVGASSDAPVAQEQTLSPTEHPAESGADDSEARQALDHSAAPPLADSPAAPPSKFAVAVQVLREQGLGVFLRRIMARLHLAESVEAREAANLARRIDAWAGRRVSGRIPLVVLVSTLDDESKGPATVALLKHIDRTAYDVALVSIFDLPDSVGIPGDIEKFVVDAGGAFDATEGDKPIDGISASDELESRWMRARSRGLAVLLDGLRPDAVLAQGFYAAIVATMAQEYQTEPTTTIVGVHNPASRFVGAQGAVDMYGALVLRYLERADLVLTPNEGIRESLFHGLGILAEKVVVLPDPIAVGEALAVGAGPGEEPEDAAEQPAIFLCVDEPGFPLDVVCLAQAVALVREHESVHCVVLGGSTLESDLQRAVARFGVGDAVTYTSDRSSLSNHLATSVACVHLARDTEVGIPGAFIEAFAAGCVVICSGGSIATNDLLGAGERGIVIPGGDPQTLAEAMLQLVWDDDARLEFAGRANAYYESTTATTVVPVLERLIEDAVRQTERNPSHSEQVTPEA